MNEPIDNETPALHNYDMDIRKLGATRIAISTAKGVYFPAYRFNDYRYIDSGGFSIPLEESPRLYEILTMEYKHFKYTIDEYTSNYITEYLEREKKSFFYATANDAPEIPTEFGPIELRPFQKAALRYLEFSQDNKILALDMGLGKTAIAVAYAERGNYRTLWITKASLMHNLDREIRKLTGHRPVLLGGRHPDATTMKALLTKDIRHFILNYEVVGTEITNEEGVVTSRPWVDAINMISGIGFLDLIVADEAHACKNISAKRTQAMLRMKTKHRLPMTGTPLVNRVRELYPLLNWVAPDIYHSEQSFLNTYDDGRGNPKNPKQLQKALQPYLFRRAKRDVLTDLPPINRITHNVELSPLHKQRYEDALDMVFTTIDGNEMDINNVLAQLTRLRQIVADAKADHTVEYLQNFLEETNEKVLVFSNFTLPVRQIAAEMQCNAIYGDVPNEVRMSYVDDFNNNPDTRILVLSVATGQEGLNLTAASTVIFNDFSFVPKDHTQAEARCYGRLNDLHGATSVWMQIDKTVDELINNLLQTKMKRFESAIEGVKDYNREQEGIFQEFISQLRGLR
jgi:SNF2 family DNA or RNA helicase